MFFTAAPAKRNSFVGVREQIRRRLQPKRDQRKEVSRGRPAHSAAATAPEAGKVVPALPAAGRFAAAHRSLSRPLCWSADQSDRRFRRFGRALWFGVPAVRYRIKPRSGKLFRGYGLSRAVSASPRITADVEIKRLDGPGSSEIGGRGPAPRTPKPGPSKSSFSASHCSSACPLAEISEDRQLPRRSLFRSAGADLSNGPSIRPHR